MGASASNLGRSIGVGRPRSLRTRIFNRRVRICLELLLLCWLGVAFVRQLHVKHQAELLLEAYSYPPWPKDRSLGLPIGRFLMNPFAPDPRYVWLYTNGGWETVIDLQAGYVGMNPK